MTAIAFDVDAPGHGKDVDMPSWWGGERPKVERLGTFGYRTRGGYRVVYVLASPILLTCQADAEAWSAFYLSSVAFLRRTTGIAADPVADWQRLFRLPHATRDEGGSPESLPTVGDASAIAAWSPTITDADRDVAATLRKRPTVRKAPPQSGRVPIVGGSGRGLLYHLFEQSGLLGRCISDAAGKYAVTCPRDAEHGKRGCDGSTVLYVPTGTEEVGWLHCSHTSHGHDRWTHRDVLAQFSETDIAFARQAAGLPTRGRRVA